MADFIKARPAASAPQPLPQDAAASRFAQDYPALYEYLTVTAWADGSQRATASLTLFQDEGRLKVCLHDRDVGRVAFVAAWTVEDLLRALEEGLLADSIDWRPARGEGGKRRR